MSRLFVVTGCEHSGTAWAAALFTGLGVECGHERWHTLRPYAGMGGPDSSWMAVPRLAELDAMAVVHLVRDPLAVLKSVMRSRAAAPRDTRPYDRFIAAHLGDAWVPGQDVWPLMVRHVATWDLAVRSHPGAHLLQVDRATPEQVAAAVAHATGSPPPPGRVAEVLRRLGRDVNAHHRHRRDVDAAVTWPRILSAPHGRALADRARAYDYPHP